MADRSIRSSRFDLARTRSAAYQRSFCEYGRDHSATLSSTALVHAACSRSTSSGGTLARARTSRAETMTSAAKAIRYRSGTTDGGGRMVGNILPCGRVSKPDFVLIIEPVLVEWPLAQIDHPPDEPRLHFCLICIVGLPVHFHRAAPPISCRQQTVAA